MVGSWKHISGMQILKACQVGATAARSSADDCQFEKVMFDIKIFIVCRDLLSIAPCVNNWREIFHAVNAKV